ncbi:30S ribosomal protein S10 [Diaporthe helianthi]|uniref:Small ribosomal subunit protein uS10m n=1 Tax=Diaporthe helianthi TaxID=158607 RepID=A0A2P5IG13_DIAHE|nr:30S ribosomal protein S10 [Diaporthe helianthi]
MNAPPVLRPLRAILQRRLQLVPSRPIRTPYYARASQLRPQFRCNSSTTKDPAAKLDSPAEEPAKELSSDTQAAPPTNATEAAGQDVNPEEHLEPPERLKETQGEIAVQQAEPTEFANVQPGEPVANDEIALPEQSSSNEAALPKFDVASVKSAFQKVKLAGAEIEAGISEVVARQIEAAEAAGAAKPEETTILRPDGAFTGSTMQEGGSVSIDVHNGKVSIEKARLESGQSGMIIGGSADNAPHHVNPAAETEEVPGELQSRDQEALEAAPVASQSHVPPEAVTEQDATEPAVEAQPEPVGTAEAPAALPDEVVKAAEEVRETEEVGGGEIETSEPAVLMNTEAQDVVNEQIASSELDTTSPQQPASPAAAKKNAAKKRKHDRLNAAAEKELADTAEEKAAQLLEANGEDDDVPDEPSRLPRNVQAFYLQPLRREATYNIPSCNLQLRSYSVRPLESFCDFALRAAYYLGLPAYGPTPLPKIIQRWTVPKSSFIFKKSQENFERITRRRLIQIRDGHPETVQIWLAFLQKHQQAGVGMKANIWEFSNLDVAKELDKAYEEAKPLIKEKFKLLGQSKEIATIEKVDELLTSERYKLAGGR